MSLKVELNPSVVPPGIAIGRFLPVAYRGKKSVAAKQTGDFKFARMINSSDTSSSNDWEVLSDQWGLVKYEYYRGGKRDFFGNFPHNVYTFKNHINLNGVEIGPDDSKKLFPNLAEVVDILKSCKRTTILKDVIDFADRFYKAAVVAAKRLEQTEEAELKKRFLSLVYLSDYLGDDEKQRLYKIINSLVEVDSRITAHDRQWILGKSNGTCMESYTMLREHAPHLSGLVSEEYNAKLARFRMTRAEQMLTYKRRGASFHTILDREVGQKEKELYKQGFSFYKIYELESGYRSKDGKPGIFE